MDAETPPNIDIASYEVAAPERQTLPLVFASPHSGSHYPPEFLAASRLDALALRRSEDSFVDELFQWAPRLGAPLIRALFPRAFIDPNREPFELDPAMFADRLPPYANTRSPRVSAGLGTIARIVASGADIYRAKLSFSDALHRLQTYYWPYHRALGDLVERTRRDFAFCILVDCHSMPSAGCPLAPDVGQGRVDIVLGDCHGTACSPRVIEMAHGALTSLGYRVARNTPYAGGYVTRHYGRPGRGVHGLQIEINRAIYMHESTYGRGPNMTRLADDLRHLITSLGGVEAREIAA